MKKKILSTRQPCPTPISRRHFLASSGRAALVGAAFWLRRDNVVAATATPEAVVLKRDHSPSQVEVPVTVCRALRGRWRRAARQGRLHLRFGAKEKSGSATLVPVQAEELPTGGNFRLTWLMPASVGAGEPGAWVEEPPENPTSMRAVSEAGGAWLDLWQGSDPVLRYRYAAVEPAEHLAAVAEPNRKYAVARGDYIHPLFGPHGETLTKDWSPDHPHHRGIYWAWPEVDWHGQRGDLHALQRVFARPAGGCQAQSGPVFAQLTAQNEWRWEDREPIVNERATIRAYRATSDGRLIDLIFQLEARQDPVLLARRETSHYGGLNLRLNAVQNQQITQHTDLPGSAPRRAWSDLSGLFAGAEKPSGVTVIQMASNPDYPGDWIEYPQLNWLQPTFPASGTRYELRRGVPLVLKFRLWIHAGAPLPAELGAELWDAAHAPFSPLT